MHTRSIEVDPDAHFALANGAVGGPAVPVDAGLVEHLDLLILGPAPAASALAVDAARVAGPARTVRAAATTSVAGSDMPRVIAFDPTRREARLQRGDVAWQATFSRAALLPAPTFAAIPGAEDHGIVLASPGADRWLYDRLGTLPRRAAVEPRPERRAALETVAIIGGGPSGIRLAARLARELAGTGLRIALIDGAARLFPDLPDRVERHLVSRLTAAGVLVLAGTAPVRVSPTGVVMPGGAVVPTRTVLLADAWQERPAWADVPGTHAVRPDQGTVVELGSGPRSADLPCGSGTPAAHWRESVAAALLDRPSAVSRELWSLDVGLGGGPVAVVSGRVLTGRWARIATQLAMRAR